VSLVGQTIGGEHGNFWCVLLASVSPHAYIA
jgi:hypothetical protein